MIDISKVMVEQVDILSEMEVLNKRMKEVAVNNVISVEEIKVYDIGVENTMSALKSLITHSEGEKDRLIYQKYGKQSDLVKYRLLFDAIKELELTNQLHLIENNGDGNG